MGTSMLTPVPALRVPTGSFDFLFLLSHLDPKLDLYLTILRPVLDL